jgi:hypothetical protein
MQKRITGLEHLGRGENCFQWRIDPVTKVVLTKAEVVVSKKNERMRIYQANKRAMVKAATRVNPENFSCASFTPNSTKAPR